MKDFHGGIQFLTQFLYIIRDMASSDDERNRKNALILQQNIFYHDLCRIAKTAFILYQEGSHSKQFLHDSIEFNYLMIDMLEEYSKGKILTIQTQRKKKVKKTRQIAQEDQDGEFDPNEGEKDVLDDDDSLAEESDDDHEEKYVERQFNFVSEISIFVDYAVISKYLLVIRDKDYNKNALLL